MLTPKVNAHHFKLLRHGVVGRIVGLSPLIRNTQASSSPIRSVTTYYHFTTAASTPSMYAFLGNFEARRVSGVWFREALP